MSRSLAMLLVGVLVACNSHPTTPVTVPLTSYESRIMDPDDLYLDGKVAAIDPEAFTLQAQARASAGKFTIELPSAGPWILVVAIEGLEPYADWEFTFGEGPVIVDAKRLPRPALGDVFQEEIEEEPATWIVPAYKTTPAQLPLGDVNEDGEVNSLDAIALFVWIMSGEEQRHANPLNETLADVDKDGVITWIDASIIGSYATGSFTNNPYGVGELVDIRAIATLTPDPSLGAFNNDGSWKTFTVQLAGVDSVLIEVNAPDTDLVMEIAGGYKAPPTNYCGPEVSDSPSRYRKDGYKLHLAGCLPGGTAVVIKDPAGEVLNSYDVTVSSSAGAEIDLVDIDTPDIDEQRLIDGSRLYYIRSRWIWYSNLDGSGMTQIKLPNNDDMWPMGFFVEDTTDKLYFADGRTGTIHRADLDGSNLETLITTTENSYGGLAVDVDGGRLYWVDRVARRIYSSMLDGEDKLILYAAQHDYELTGGSGIWLYLDKLNGHLYWADKYYIYRANLDGSNVENLWSSWMKEGYEGMFISSDGHFYSGGTKLLYRRDMSDSDSGNYEEILSYENRDIASIRAVVCDEEAQKIYFCDVNAKIIYRVNMDGSGLREWITYDVSKGSVRYMHLYIPVQ